MEKRMEARLVNLPGYHPERISEKLNATLPLPDNPELQYVLKSKA
jgi:hypothetical protein